MADFIFLNEPRQDFEIFGPAGSLERSDSARDQSGFVTHGYADARFAYI